MVVFAGSSATVAEVLTSTPLETVITVGAWRWQRGHTSRPAGRSAIAGASHLPTVLPKVLSCPLAVWI